MAPEGQGSTTLDLSFLLRAPRGGRGVAPGGSYSDLSWMRGARASGHVQSVLHGARIDITIYARDAASRSLAWTGVINCRIQTNDMNALAQGLGEALGKSLGKSVPKASL